MKINDSILALKNKMLDTLNGDSSKEHIDFVNDVNKALDSINAEVTTLYEEKRDVTERYADAMKTAGSKDVVDDGSGAPEEHPKTLEECFKEELAKEASKA